MKDRLVTKEQKENMSIASYRKRYYHNNIINNPDSAVDLNLTEGSKENFSCLF